MRDTSRQAIRTVLQPSMYEVMLRTGHGTCLCRDCVADNVHELIKDLRTGHTQSYSVLSLADTDGWYYCEYCEQRFCGYDDLSMDPHEAEMQEAADSVFCSDSDLDGIY